MNTPLLSLALATYQRWEELEKVLAALLPQLDSEIELIVSDNASPNSLADKCASMCAGHDNVRIVRQAENIGALRNYQAAFEACSGDYVVCLADDDVPTPNFIRFVKDTINSRRDAGIYHFKPNPSSQKPSERLYARAGLDAVMLVFAYCGIMPGMAFSRKRFDKTLWREPNIYPQVLLAATLARDHGSVLASGPEGLKLGGDDDTAVNRARSRPADFGIGERLRHLSNATCGMAPRDRLAAMNCGVHDLVYWGWTIFDEMWIEDRATARRYVKALTQIEHVRTSPYMVLTWLHLVRRSPTLWHSAPWVISATIKGMLTAQFWNILLRWKNMKVREWGIR